MKIKIEYEKFEKERIDSYLASVYRDYSRSYFQKLIDKAKGTTTITPTFNPPPSRGRSTKAKRPLTLPSPARGEVTTTLSSPLAGKVPTKSAKGGQVVKSGGVFVNGKGVLASYKLSHGDVISFEFEKEVKLDIKPEKIKLDIIFEDADILIVNKPTGIVVHPSYGHPSGTLLNALMGYAKGKFNPYLVHRLDKDTTGLIIFAKNERAKISISKQLQKRAVKKIYYAAVKGTIVENKGRIEAPLGRSPQNRKLMTVNPLAKKMAISEFKVIARKDGYTLVEVRIITGRTHQIRSHMQYINHPVIGDQQYGGPETIAGNHYERQMLHAHQVTFTHPKTCKTVEFKAPLPPDMKTIFKK